MRVALLLAAVLLVGCHDGNRLIDPCFVDTDEDQGCGNDKPLGSKDCDQRPPCSVEDVIGNAAS